MKCTCVVEWAVPCYLFESSRFPEVTLLQDTSIAPSSPPSSPSLLVPTDIFRWRCLLITCLPTLVLRSPLAPLNIHARSELSDKNITLRPLVQILTVRTTQIKNKKCRRHHALTFTHSPFRLINHINASAPPTTKDYQPLSRWFKLMHLTCSLHVC